MLNGASLFIFFIIWLSAFLLSLLLNATTKRCSSPKLSRLADWLDRKLKWNSFFNLILAAQVELLLASIIQVKHWRWGVNGDKVACIFALITFILFSGSTFAMFHIIKAVYRRHLDAKDEKSFIAKYGILTDGLRTRLPIHKAYQFVMMARRVLLVMLLFWDE